MALTSLAIRNTESRHYGDGVTLCSGLSRHSHTETVESIMRAFQTATEKKAFAITLMITAFCCRSLWRCDPDRRNCRKLEAQLCRKGRPVTSLPSFRGEGGVRCWQVLSIITTLPHHATLAKARRERQRMQVGSDDNDFLGHVDEPDCQRGQPALVTPNPDNRYPHRTR